MSTYTTAQLVRYLSLGRARIAERPSNLGLSSESVAYRTHAPVVSQHRDSDALERSNFTVVADDLLRRFGDYVSQHAEGCDVLDGTEGPACDCARDVVTESFGHWAVGWTESVLVRVEAERLRSTDLQMPTTAWVASAEWLEALESYPVADEAHYSELEYTEALEYLASELDGLVGDWTCAVADRLSDGTTEWPSEHTGYAEIERAIHSVWTERVETAVASVSEWLRLRQAGDGQLTLEGETVQVAASPPVSLEALEALHPESVDLPYAVSRAVEGAEDYLESLESVTEALRSVCAPV